jgi:hypothetical protein
MEKFNGCAIGTVWSCMYENFSKQRFKILRSSTFSIVSSLSKMSSCLCFKTRRFRDWILSPSSGKTYSVGSGDRIQSPKCRVLKHKQDNILSKDETMDNVQECNISTMFGAVEIWLTFLLGTWHFSTGLRSMLKPVDSCFKLSEHNCLNIKLVFSQHLECLVFESISVHYIY